MQDAGSLILAPGVQAMRDPLSLRRLLHAALGVAILAGHAGASDRPVELIAREVREAVMSPGGTRPLPLAASFLTGEQNKDGVPTAKYQLGDQGWLKRGYHFLPTFQMPPPDNFGRWNGTFVGDDYYMPALDEAMRLGLPLAFYGTQWELLLRNFPDTAEGDKLWLTEADGTVLVLPGTSREQEWFDIGRRWASSSQLKRLMQRYPNPPNVVIISNNEQTKPTWGNFWQDPRVLERDPQCKAKVENGVKFSDNKPARNCVRRAFAREWKRLYGKMLDGFRAGIAGQPWADKIRLVGYDAFGPLNVGRASNWMEYSLTVHDDNDSSRVESWDPWSEVWDGGIVSLYTHSWQSFMNDYTVTSPQIESMNLVAQIEAVRKKKPDFWFEAGVWDGWAPTRYSFDDKRKQLAMNLQYATPQRYAGWIRYVMWMTRAPIVREYRDAHNRISETDGHFRAVIDATEQVWRDADLARFWKEGELVRNDAFRHPYEQWHTYDGRISLERGYMLDTPSHPRVPHQSGQDRVQGYDFRIPVYTFALRHGSELLVYAHAPAGAEQKVTIVVPGGPTLVENVPAEGRFFLVRDGRVVRRIDNQLGRDDLFFTSVRYDEKLSAGALAIAWSQAGKVERMTFTPTYHLIEEGKPIDVEILYRGDDGQTNFVIPKVDNPFTMGGWIRTYRGSEQIGEGWLTLGMSSDTLLVNDAERPYGFHQGYVNDQVKTNVAIGGSALRLKKGETNFLILYATGTERTVWRVEGSTDTKGPIGPYCWTTDTPVRVRISDDKGNTWVRNADFAGNVGKGYEQINLRLTDASGTPLASSRDAGDTRAVLPSLPLGDKLSIRLEHAHCFREPTATNEKALQLSNSGRIGILE